MWLELVLKLGVSFIVVVLYKVIFVNNGNENVILDYNKGFLLKWIIWIYFKIILIFIYSKVIEKLVLDFGKYKDFLLILKDIENFLRDNFVCLVGNESIIY